MPNGNLKAPSQVFKWFEKMKENYDKNILAIMQRFEQNNHAQQTRLDNSHQNHIDMMQNAHTSQVAQFNNQIEQQRQEIEYFKQQIAQQQQTINQLNNRYDSVMMELVTSKQQTSPYKDIFDDSYFISSKQPSSTDITFDPLLESEKEGPSTAKVTDNNERNAELTSEASYSHAMELRKSDNSNEAFVHFQHAANQGHAQAMGALARAYFLAEGVDENPLYGLAWLINAATLSLPQAIKRANYFKESEPDLYKEALEISANLLECQSKNSIETAEIS